MAAWLSELWPGGVCAWIRQFLQPEDSSETRVLSPTPTLLSLFPSHSTADPQFVTLSDDLTQHPGEGGAHP